MLYREPRGAGNAYRARQAEEVREYVERLRGESAARRAESFAPDFSSEAAYARSLAGHRARYIDMLGKPLSEARLREGAPEAETARVAEDGLGAIDRVTIKACEGLSAYGILFAPKGGGARPLIISQHGGGGTPELCSGSLDETAANHNNMTRRALERASRFSRPKCTSGRTSSGRRTTASRSILSSSSSGARSPRSTYSSSSAR